MNFADSYYKKKLIQKLVGQQELLAAYCQSTNMPLVECSTESFHDRVFVFETEDFLKEFSKPYFEKKLPLKGIKFPAKDKMRFFTTLLCMSIDEIVYIDASGRHPVQLSDFLKKQDFSNLPKEKRPIDNPQLLLSGLYFVQEASRAVPPEQKPQLKELEEEFSANLVKGVYILPVDFVVSEETLSTDSVQTIPQQFRIPLIKTPKGDTMQPLFTDHVEFARYNPENKLKALAVPFSNLSRMLAKEAKGYMLNPNGFHIHMTRELLEGLNKRFSQENPDK